MLRNKLFGDRAFYRSVIALALPIMIQNGITHLVNMLDNIMIGALGTTQMNGAAIANQLIFIFNLCIFGAVSGAGIYGAQFFGKKDWDSVRFTFRFKYLLSVLLAVAAALVFLLASEPLLSLYIEAGEAAEAKIATLGFGKQYLLVMVVGLFKIASLAAFESASRGSSQSVSGMV